MINPNCWRTPVPVDIHTCESIDPLSRMLFFEILTLCQNKEYNKSFYHGNKFINITLNRWECIFIVSKYEKSLKIGSRRIKKSLEILSKWYNEMQIESKSFWLIIKLKNYDEIIKMQSEMQNESKSNANRKQNESKSTNKSDKSEETEKTVNIITPFFENEQLNKSFLLFVEHRKQMKKKMTENAIDLTVKKINKWLKIYSVDNVIIFIEEAIERWRQTIREKTNSNSLPKQNNVFKQV